MTNKSIREYQRKNAHTLKQHRFPIPTEPKSIVYRRDREMERRREQIASGRLKKENGLVV